MKIFLRILISATILSFLSTAQSSAATSVLVNGMTNVMCGGGAVDDSPVLQAAFDAGPTIVVGVCFNSPMNLTNRSPYIRGLGARNTDFNPLPAAAASYATKHGHMFDLTGSYLINIADFSIGWNNCGGDLHVGNDIVMRDAFFLSASIPQTANIAKLSNILIKGKFQTTGIYGYGFYNATMDNVFVSNFYPGAETAASAVYVTNKNGWSLESQFATIATDVITPANWSFVGGSEIHLFPGSGGNSSLVYLDGATDVHFIGTNFSAGGTSFVIVTQSVSHVIFEGDQFGTESEPVSPSSIVYVAAGSSITDVSWISSDESPFPRYSGPGGHP